MKKAPNRSNHEKPKKKNFFDIVSVSNREDAIASTPNDTTPLSPSNSQISEEEEVIT